LNPRRAKPTSATMLRNLIAAPSLSQSSKAHVDQQGGKWHVAEEPFRFDVEE
jgi:hypothetical protein